MRPSRSLVSSGIAGALCAALLNAPLVSAQTAPGPSRDWGKGGVCYEIFVRSFYDSDGDGVGDIRGMTEKLDYINDGNPSARRDLGANCIWLMPVAQSPSYHGYDVTNYYQVNRDYGTNEDFKRFMDEAHKRGIRVIVDLVLNHSSSEHPYFQAALLDSSSQYHGWYSWSPAQRRGIGWEAPVWHRNPFRDEYYYGLFWGGMPDLNLANPAVKEEALKISSFWLNDMKAYYFSQREAAGLNPLDRDAFEHEFELQTVQRCLKAAGTFSFQSAARDKTYFIPFIKPMFRISLQAMQRLDRYPQLQEILMQEL